MTPQLVLGTAEFGHPEYAPHPTRQEIVRILNLAWRAGIRTLDTADTYNGYNGLYGGFKLLEKTRAIGRDIYHYQPGEAAKDVKRASVYDVAQLTDQLELAIVPIHINKTDFIRRYPQRCAVFARSVFANGKLFEEGYSVFDCLDFVNRLPLTGVIVGVRSVKELEQILEAYR